MNFDVSALSAKLGGGSLTCDLSDSSEAVGVLPSTFGWRSNTSGFFGPAHTIAAPEGDLASIYEGVCTAEAGSVLVIATGGAICAIWGETLTREALARGVVGVVLDGFCRDVTAVKVSGLTVVGRGTSPKRAERLNQGRIGESIEVHGVTVAAYDFIVSDENGTVVVPKTQFEILAETVLDPAPEENYEVTR